MSDIIGGRSYIESTNKHKIMTKVHDVLCSDNVIAKNPNGVDCYKSKMNIEQSVMLTIMLWAQVRSKDPNTKVGAAIYDYDSGAMFLGYNGFPNGIEDEVSVWDNRDTKSNDNKYGLVLHAEQNVLFKALNKFNPSTSKMFVTHFPCAECVKNVIIPSRIKTIYYSDEHVHCQFSQKLLKMAGIEVIKLSI